MRFGHNSNPGRREWVTRNFHSLPSDHEKIEWISENVNQDKIDSKKEWVTEDVNPPSKMFAKEEWKTANFSDGLTQKTEWVTESIRSKWDLNPNRWVAQSLNPASSNGTVMRWVAEKPELNGLVKKVISKTITKP